MVYKPEIDGLRAIASLLVLLCHFQLFTTGGFIGVDVFFVISGFLITAILINNISNRQFSLPNFYARRFIRLYPALILMVALTFIAALLIADPATLKNIARTAKYTLLSASNFFFYKHQGYFDIAANKQAFLHTWSLGVEWQFYLIWPLLVWLLLKISRIALLFVLVLICIVSVYASENLLATNSSAAYYLMPYRAFELGIGALIFFIYDKPLKPAAGATLTALGIAAIFYAAITFSPATPFPGYNGLIPCLGTAACIYGSQSFQQGNWLRLKPIVYLGKIAYSIYLIHWPLLVLYLYFVGSDGNLHIIEKLALFIVTLILGALSYELVEKRINWKRLNNFHIKPAITCLCLFLLVICASFGADYLNKKSDGLLWRLGNSSLKNSDYFIGARTGYSDRTLLGAENTQPLAIVAGDSFAQSYSSGLNLYLQQQNKSVEIISRIGCLFSSEYIRTDVSVQEQNTCQNVYQSTIEKIKAQNLPLIVIASWDNYKIHDFISIKDGTRTNFKHNQPSYNEFIRENLDQTLRDLNGHPLILIAAVPYYKIDNNEKNCLARPNILFSSACRKNMLTQYPLEQSATHSINAFLKDYAAQHPGDVYFVDPTAQACPNSICTIEHNAMLYDDGSHLSRYGATLLTPALWQGIEKIISKKPQ